MSATVPVLDPRYFRPSVPPETRQCYRILGETIRDQDLASVVSLVNDEPRSQDYLTEGLRAAIYQQNLKLMQYFLENGAAINQAISLAAAWVKRMPVFQLLFEYGWDINAPLTEHETLLMNVLEDEDLVKWFLSRGAIVEPTPEMDTNHSAYSSLLDLASAQSSIACFDLLLAHGATRDGSHPLHIAAGLGAGHERIPMMAHLISLGFDVNGTDDSRRYHAIGTPLHYAVRSNSSVNVNFLLQQGADPHKSVGPFGSPIEMAEQMGLKEIFGSLSGLSLSERTEIQTSASTGGHLPS